MTHERIQIYLPQVHLKTKQENKRKILKAVADFTCLIF